MNIVLINHYAGGPSMGMEFRPYYLATEWKKLGHQVIVVGGTYSHLRSKQPKARDGEVQTIDGVQYLWLETNAYSGNGAARLKSMIVFARKLYTKLTRYLDSFHPDLFIASSTYPLDNFPARSLAKKYKAKYCYEVHDLWPLSPMELGNMSRFNPFIMLMQLAENFAYRKSDFVISMLPNALQHMVEHGLDPAKYKHVPNGIFMDEWKQQKPLNESTANTISNLKTGGKFLVGYAGGQATANALDNLIAAAALAENIYPELVFVLVGDGNEKLRLVKMAEQLRLQNTFFLPSVPKLQVPSLLSYFDVLYLGSLDNPLYRFGISPNKLMDYMMAGKPIVHAVNAGNDIVGDAGCGIRVIPDKPEDTLQAIVKLSLLLPAEREALGERGRRYALEKHDYTVLAKEFINFAESKL